MTEFFVTASCCYYNKVFIYVKINYLDDTSKIKTYVGSDGKLHFVNKAGADTVLNFSSGAIKKIEVISEYRCTSSTHTINVSSVLNQNGIDINSVTTDNFLISKTSCRTFDIAYYILAPSITYENGIITISNGQYSPGTGKEIYYTLTIVCIV